MMDDFNEYEKFLDYKRALRNYIRDAMDTYKQDIIDSFVLYFGEKYRRSFEEKYEYITSVFWASPDSVFKYVKNKKENKKYALTVACLEDIGVLGAEDFTNLKTLKTLQILFGDKVLISSDFDAMDISSFLNENDDRKQRVLERVKANRNSSLPLLSKDDEKNTKLLKLFAEIIKTYSKKLADFEFNIDNNEGFIAEFLQLQRDTRSFEAASQYEVMNISGFSSNLNASTMSVLFKDNVNNSICSGAETGPYYTNGVFLTFCLIKLFWADDETIIHELLHAFSEEPLLFLEEELICKSGFVVISNADEKIVKFNELMTRIMAGKIVEILHDKGIYILNKKFNLEGDRLKNRSLLIFFERFEEYIKESYITINTNSFIQRIGKENFKELLDFYMLAKEEDKIEGIDRLIRKMKKHYRRNR